MPTLLVEVILAMGSGSLSSNTTADNNTGLGYLALNQNTTGFDNTASRFSIFRCQHNWKSKYCDRSRVYDLKLQSGVNNVAVGHRALKLNTTGSSNTALGIKVLWNSIQLEQVLWL